MIQIVTPQSLVLELQRALLSGAHPQLRQASIQADAVASIFHIRFEYDGHPSDEARGDCARAAADVVAAFSGQWRLDEQHVSIPSPLRLSPLAHIAYQGRSTREAT